ncbi:S41 family peptidase [Maribacter sp. 2307ULW6-5]|uniref:S41 family peptidase n=1 Tax=Maribacter sp. 2307ULW6-5 TaxID=3386275 RepID=UPI0039BC7ABC
MNLKPTFLFLVFTAILVAQTEPQWLRYPAISPDGATVAFTYKGNLYKVAATGGEAQQLTFHKAHDRSVVWSRDGGTLAFASDRYGNFDVFAMPAQGGEATRLTYHSADEVPYTFSANDSLVFFGAARLDAASHRQYPNANLPELYAVPTTGGRVDQMLTVPAQDVQVNVAGSLWVYHDKKGYENDFRKHHTSSITRDVWSYDPKTGTHQKLTHFNGEDRNPVFSKDGKTLYYLSEESGSFNVHTLDLANTGNTQQVTQFKQHPVRYLSMGNGVMAFGHDGVLYTLEEGGEPRKIPITIRTQAGSNSVETIKVNGGVREMDIAPNGKEIAFVSRGEVFVTSVDGSMTKRITNTPQQERFVQFMPQGNALAYASERNGKWHIFKSSIVRPDEPFFFASTLVKEDTLLSTDTDVYLPKFSPNGKFMAYVEGRRSLRVMDLKTKETTTLLTPEDLYHFQDGDQDFSWSPDSQWLLVDWGATLSNNEILLLSADGSQRMNLTQSGYNDGNPQWVNGGKQLLWFANREGLKSYATSGRTERDVYSMFLTQDAWDKFNLTKEQYDLKKLLEEEEKATGEPDSESAKKKEDKKKENKAVDPVSLDLEDVRERKARLTIHSSRLADAVLSKDEEKLYYLTRFEKDLNLWETELRSKSTKMLITLNAKSGNLQWDPGKEHLYLLADGKIAKLDLKAAKEKPVKIAAEMTLDTEAQRRYMFDHIWLRTKGIFYHSNFHGVDWEAMRSEYEKYLPHVGNGYEFSDMISELLGELNVSHAGGRYADAMENGDETASLGIFMDYGHRGNGIKVAEVIKGGPLDKANVAIVPGSVIQSINGIPLLPNKDLASHLNRLAKKFTLLDVVAPDGKRQQITVVPISQQEERRLLYARWVKQNEQEVAKKSSGRLGYVHIPGMADGPYRNIYEKMLGKYAASEGVIVDTRFNGGGDLVADLAMFFTGVPFLSYETEDRKVGGEPTSRYTKPTLAIFNESMYSDGSCFASGWTDLKIGTSVGMPVPGTCSFAGWERLPNGGRWGVVPVSAKNMAGEWLENNQTEPDILVKNHPDAIAKGTDQQLERSILQLLKELDAAAGN